MSESHQELVPAHEMQPEQHLSVVAAEVNQQIATAKKYPRNVRTFIDTATSLATLSEEIAGSCFYRLERKDGRSGQIKVIEGPSVRMAEIVCHAWKNCRAASRVVEETDNFIVAQGVFIDLESNTAVTAEVRRRITDRQGRKFSDDMIAVTANAACSIAMRNAIVKGVPRAFWDQSYNAARDTFRGNAESLGQRRAKMFGYFKQLGISEERVLASVARTSMEAVTLDDLMRLRGFATAIKDGETTIEEAFPDPNAKPPATKTDAVKEAIAAKLAERQTPASAPEPAAQGSPYSRYADAIRACGDVDAANDIWNQVDASSGLDEVDKLNLQEMLRQRLEFLQAPEKPKAKRGGQKAFLEDGPPPATAGGM